MSTFQFVDLRPSTKPYITENSMYMAFRRAKLLRCAIFTSTVPLLLQNQQTYKWLRSATTREPLSLYEPCTHQKLSNLTRLLNKFSHFSTGRLSSSRLANRYVLKDAFSAELLGADRVSWVLKMMSSGSRTTTL